MIHVSKKNYNGNLTLLGKIPHIKGDSPFGLEKWPSKHNSPFFSENWEGGVEGIQIRNQLFVKLASLFALRFS